VRGGGKQASSFITAAVSPRSKGPPALIPKSRQGTFQSTRLRIRRGGEERELEIVVGSVELVNYRIVDGKAPTPEQLKIRESWLQR
jgi:hypothetical protein